MGRVRVGTGRRGVRKEGGKGSRQRKLVFNIKISSM